MPQKVLIFRFYLKCVNARDPGIYFFQAGHCRADGTSRITNYYNNFGPGHMLYPLSGHGESACYYYIY
jgi:hypothetical protein